MNNQKFQMLKLESTKLQVLNLVMNVNMDGDLHISSIEESKHDDLNLGTQLSQLDSHGNLCIFVGNLQHLVDLPHFVEYIQQCDEKLDINNQTWAEFVWPPLKLQDVKGKLLKTIAHELIVVDNSHGYDDPSFQAYQKMTLVT